MNAVASPRPTQAPSGEPSLFESLRRAHGPEPLRVEGTWPEDLRGTLYRVGPGVFERFGKRVQHPFEADGVLSSVRAVDGVVRGAVQVVQSEGYLEEEAAQRNLYSSAAAYPWRLRSALLQRGKNTGNTSVFWWQGRCFALYEGGQPTEIDPRSLETLGTRDLGGVLGPAFSAHPRRVQRLGCTFNFGVQYAKEMTIRVYALPDEGPVRELSSFTSPWMTMVHDFIATERHLVFLLAPAKLVLWKALLQVGSFADWFQWNPQLGAQLVVMPLETPERVQRISVDPFWVWHFVNGYEDRDRVVIDMCQYPDLDSLKTIGGVEGIVPPRLSRGLIDPERGKFEMTPLTGSIAEFPSVHPRSSGGAHQLAWMVSTDQDSPYAKGILQVDISRGEVRSWWPESAAVSEPIVVPKPGRNEEGAVWLLVLLHYDQRCCLAILDAEKLESGPVCKAWFDQPLPMTFHGTFVQ